MFDRDEISIVFNAYTVQIRVLSHIQPSAMNIVML